MKISVITVVLNNRDYIKDCIESILSQRGVDIEYIVIDGGSTDGTVDIIKNYENRLSRWVSEPDQGIYDAMNKGLRYATGDVIGFLNADDVYADDDVLGTVSSAMGDTGTDACYGDLVYGERWNVNKIIRYWRSRRFEPGLFKKGWVPPHPTFFVRKTLYDLYGGFDLNYTLAADFELMARLLELHLVRSVYIPRILVRMRVGGATNRSIANIIRQNVEIIRACRQHDITRSPSLFIMRRVIARLRQFSLKLSL